MTSLLVSCNTTIDQSLPLQQSNKKDCRIIEHKMGETEICGIPQRIVVLSPYLLEPLLALNIQPIAYADHIAFHKEDYDHPAEQIPYLGKYINKSIANVGIAYMPSLEAIVKTKPDLILSPDHNKNEYQKFSQFAPTLMLSWNESTENLEKIARAVKREEKVEQLLQETQQEIEKAKQEFSKIVANYPKILLLHAQDLQELSIANNESICSSLIEELGFELVSLPEVDTSKNSRLPLSLEALPKLDNANSIIILGYNFQEFSKLINRQNFTEHQLSNLQQKWSKNPITQSMKASQENRVYYIPTYLCTGLPGFLVQNFILMN
ncbi:iron-siderophore ABC transporter substrate-binding protein [Synechocystis salina]|uniref:iron-siderophore ABC transporter substrate-binding protein n=1 Tax=Synechocystis salina TaxID=945780 RepID=UPI001D13FCB0|nr:iron-siderophore ABC transporter substrate-binding protein [Synechocystis salina]